MALIGEAKKFAAGRRKTLALLKADGKKGDLLALALMDAVANLLETDLYLSGHGIALAEQAAELLRDESEGSNATAFAVTAVVHLL